MARTFNGSSDNIDLGNAASGPLFNITGAVSISWWMFPTSTPSAAQYFVPVSKGFDGTHQPWATAYQNDSNTSSLPGLLFNVNTAGPFCVYVHTFTTSVWAQCLCTYDNTNARIYVGGSLVAGPTAITSAAATSSKKAYIGAVDLNGVLGRFFVGRLADVAIWNTALSAHEALALASGVRPYHIRNNGSLKAYFPLDGIGSSEADLSGNAIAATLTGTAGGFGPPFSPYTGLRTSVSPGAPNVIFRKNLSSLGTRVGSRQVHVGGW